MVEPRVIPRDQHPISRRDIDSDALKVLYRLRQGNHVAYLVGGSVRDLFLGRHPKDFDIGTSAHPYQVKKLFRNCWIIGRRFRLAHVKFGSKVIEVATFRRQVAPGEEVVQDGVPAPDPSTPEGAHLIHHDNTFGTPEEDAFRRDFTVNALFYDIATFSIVDYVGGLDDLRDRVIRSIGDPDVRLKEDPVRMLRAIALAARLDFTIDPPLEDSIRTHRQEIAKSSPARMLEEYYKILRAGSSEKAFRALDDVGLLEPTAPELHKAAGATLWQSLAALDAYRRRFEATPDTLTNPILLGTLLVCTGFASQRHDAIPKLGALPLARRDVERLRQILGLQRRLHDVTASPRAQRALAHRSIFKDALTWLEIHGGDPDLVAHWTAMKETAGNPEHAGEHHQPAEGEEPPRRKRRRRRRRRRSFGPPSTPGT
ncbi:MAG TPA: polynucleotide adenylyltransferase PcnB [Vicinamibacterales bacterium]|nr:polynucleotide adenylyltransferase PcnB [Vicinamibacterales bacterium]